MNRDQRLVRHVTIHALDQSRNPNPEDNLTRILARVTHQHGEDSLREFIRETMLNDKSDEAAGTYVYGDGAVGQQLGIAIRRIAQTVE